MAILDSTALDDSQQTGFIDRYTIAQMGRNVWDQFTTPDWEIMSSRRGNPGRTFNLPILERITPQPTALPEDSDVAASTFTDALATVTMNEYGDGVDSSTFHRETSFYDVHGAAAELLAENMTEVKELLARYAYLSGSRIYYPGNAAALTTLDHTNSSYRASFKNFRRMKLRAEALEIPPFADGSYAAVIHPSVADDLMDDSLWENIGVYCDPKMIWDGTAASLQAGAKFQGEIGRLAGIRVCQSTFGKVLYGGGAVAQTVTDIDGAIAAGATSVIATLGTSLAAGDHILLGATETAGSEQVLITDDSSTPTFTIEGVGNTRNNTGVKYAHADAAAITEASQVVEIPVIGRNSVLKVWHDHTESDGRVTIKEKEGLTIAGRFWTYSWLGWWGYSITQENFLIKGRFAVSEKNPGYYREL